MAEGRAEVSSTAGRERQMLGCDASAHSQHQMPHHDENQGSRSITGSSAAPADAEVPRHGSAAEEMVPRQLPKLRIEGCSGKFQMVNGTYEPTGFHQSRPYWMSSYFLEGTHGRPGEWIRQYLYHAVHHGKPRWIVSNRMTHDVKCYAFVLHEPENAVDPSECTRPWSTFGHDHKWIRDSGMKCTRLETETQDARLHFHSFAQRFAKDMETHGLLDNVKIKQLWRRCNRTMTGGAELSDIRHVVNDLVALDCWPGRPLKDHDDIVFDEALRATWGSLSQYSHAGQDRVWEEQFHEFLLNLLWLCILHDIFKDQDQKILDDKLGVSARRFAEYLDKLEITGVSGEDMFDNLLRTLQLSRRHVKFTEFCCFVRLECWACLPEVKPSIHFLSLPLSEEHDKDMKMVKKFQTSWILRKEISWHDFQKAKEELKHLVADTPRCNQLARLVFKEMGTEDWHQAMERFQRLPSTSWPRFLCHREVFESAFRATMPEERGGQGRLQAANCVTFLNCLFWMHFVYWLFFKYPDRAVRLNEHNFTWALALFGPSEIKVANKLQAQGHFRRLLEMHNPHGSDISLDDFTMFIADGRDPGLRGRYPDQADGPDQFPN